MRQPDPGVFLVDIEHHAAAAVRFLGTHTLAEYAGDEKTRAAVERALEIVGEATKRLVEQCPEIGRRIPHWKEIIGFRNILAHGYAVVDDERVFRIVSEDVPELIAGVRALLAEIPEPGSEP